MSHDKASSECGTRPHSPDLHIAIAILQERLNNLEEDHKAALAEINELKQDRNKALKWGIALLGSAVITMASWIFKYFEKAIS